MSVRLRQDCQRLGQFILIVLLINYDRKLITRAELQLQLKCHENYSTKAPVNYFRKCINTNLNNFENVKLMGGGGLHWF